MRIEQGVAWVDLPDATFRTATLGECAARIAELEFEIDVLRRYGNKDCTAMADEQLAKKRAGQKCDFED